MGSAVVVPRDPDADELTVAGLAALGAGSVCDEEPIHLSGAIQPRGFLLGVDPHTSVVGVASANVADHIAVDPAAVLGSTLTQVLGAAAAGRVGELLVPAVRARADPLPLELPLVLGSAAFEVIAHASGALVLLEFESVPTAEAGSTIFHEVIRRALDPDHTSSDTPTVCRAAADGVREVSGFDRVLVYRFDDDGHGFVVAESVAADSGAESLLGLHYPEGDIPRQARSLMLRKRIRMISDIDYVPVPLLGLPGRPGVDSLDLTMSELRSVSPLHLQYLHEMGVAATLSISLVANDRLWGMVLCHHHTPRPVSHRVRAVCETLARTLCLQLDVARLRSGRERAAVETRLVNEVVTALGEPQSLDDTVAAAAGALRDITGADGVLVRLDGEIAAPGATLMPVAELAAFVARASVLAAGADGGVWSTDALADLVAPADASGAAGASEASGAAEPSEVAGMLVLPLAGVSDGLIVWLRREHVQVTSWAGKKRVDPATGRTFDPHEEVLRGHSRPWTVDETTAAETLGRALPEALLRRTRRLLAERDAGSQAERAASQVTRERLEHELQRKLRLESLGKLAGGVAHDFNNLLSVILSHAEFVEDEVRAAATGADGERWVAVTRDTEQITSATQRAAQLTRQLLSFARREVTQPRPLDLNQVITGLEMLLRRTLGHHVDLRLVLSAGSTMVLADPEQLERVLVNLAVNSRDAMLDGGVLTVTTDTLSIDEGDVSDGLARVGGLYVRMRVDDTGHGIPKDVLDRVFEPFFTTRGDGGGSGLGLATVHGIVDQAGGRVTIYSEPGHGTSITVLLPATGATPAVPVAPTPAVTAKAQTVLLVEDEPAIREITRRILARSGYLVLVAAGGIEALAIAAAFAPAIDLLLTDVIMPGMRGKEVAARLTEMRPDIRVLFMSGFALSVATDSGNLEPGARLIDKPFTRAQLLSKLAEVG